jgi:hypothetical protein
MGSGKLGEVFVTSIRSLHVFRNGCKQPCRIQKQHRLHIKEGWNLESGRDRCTWVPMSRFSILHVSCVPYVSFVP